MSVLNVITIAVSVLSVAISVRSLMSTRSQRIRRREELEAMTVEAAADDAYRTVNGFWLDMDRCYISGCNCGNPKADDE